MTLKLFEIAFWRLKVNILLHKRDISHDVTKLCNSQVYIISLLDAMSCDKGTFYFEIQFMRCWFLSHMRAAKAQATVHRYSIKPDMSLFPH